MKKILILLFVTLLTVTSCKKLTDFNNNEKEASIVSSESLMSNAEKALMDQITTSSINFNPTKLLMQYWTQTVYIDESNYDYTTRKISDAEFRIMYRDILRDLKESKKVVGNEAEAISSAAVKKNKIAITEILSVYTYHRLVDFYGNVPYDQSLDINNVLPAYDDAKTIYKKLFERLDAAIASIDVSKPGFADGADIFYNSDMGKWKKFANSLKLKMAVGVADVSDLAPGAKAAEALSGGVFNNLADGAYFKYLTSSPNGNPMWEDIIVSDRLDFVAGNTMVDMMNTLKDPRRQYYMDTLLHDANGNIVYKGGVIGNPNDYTSSSHINPRTILLPTTMGILFDYTEVQFYLAEAAERGFIGGSAEQYYKEGVKSSLQHWGVADSLSSWYLNSPDVAFPTAAGSNLEKIAKQAWLAYYTRGDIAWNTWRRLDAPKLNTVTGKTLADVPVRYTYPISEQTLNGANYGTAASAIGGDKVTTKLFWDKK